ncbi:MAG: ParB/RepB/Spo0J family partition protein [Isosphaeraceae bacterium]
MAGIKSELLAGVAASMRDRENIRGESTAPRPSLDRQAEGRRRLDSACVIRVDRIAADPNQPRTEFDPDALARLAESLRSRGQLQPIRVRWDAASDRYIVVVGERRWRAAQLAGLETLACVVVTGGASAEDLLEDQLIENCLREDLRPIEQAKAFRSLLSGRGLTQRQLADRLQVGQGTISRALALLGLPAEVQSAVDAGEIGPDTAYQLTKVEDAGEQAGLAREAARGALKRDDVKARGSKPRKGRATARVKSRVFRSAWGRVTVELKKAEGSAAIRAALAEALAALDLELSSQDQEAA